MGLSFSSGGAILPVDDGWADWRFPMEVARTWSKGEGTKAEENQRLRSGQVSCDIKGYRFERELR